MNYKLSFLFVLGCAILCCSSISPTAPNKVIHVLPANEVVINLPGYSADGIIKNMIIQTLPESGYLYQVSDIYEKYGYNPTHDKNGLISSVPMIVKSSKYNVVYVRPENDYYPENGKYGEFSYVVSNSATTSDPGVILLTYDEISMQSTFDLDDENWTIEDNGDVKRVVYDPTRRGELQFYIYAEEQLIRTDSVTGNDKQLWYFNAPKKFLGNHWEIYGGYLRFTIGAAAGNFGSDTDLNKNGKLELVQLECKTCNNNYGIRLAYLLDATDARSFDGTTKTFTIKLDELSVGWYKDPQNVNAVWNIPSQCEFILVLSDLSSVKILGDFTKQYESIGIDNVAYLHNPNSKRLNLACYQ